MLNTLAAESDGVPIVKVKVVNVSNGETIVLDPYEFTSLEGADKGIESVLN